MNIIYFCHYLFIFSLMLETETHQSGVPVVGVAAGTAFRLLVNLRAPHFDFLL